MIWHKLGPGLLFAGAAIGTSHLVQSTRAGALFGLGFLGVVVFANLVKYQAFRAGPLYASVTGESLIAGYARLGLWVVVVVALVMLGVQAIIIAATAITTAGIGLALLQTLEFHSTFDPRIVGVGLLVLAAMLVRSGGYKLLERINRICVILLSLCTVLATALALPAVQWNFSLEPFASMEVEVFVFAVAVMGFMPSALDLSVIHSLWSVEKYQQQNTHDASTVADTLFDFRIGYIGSALLAICFLLMGAGVMHPTGIQPVTDAPGFALQILTLYTSTLGTWSGWVVGICALAVMFSTLLAVVDGMPRMQVACLREINPKLNLNVSMYWVTGVLVFAAAFVLLRLMGSFTAFIDVVTITSFVLAPLFALLNHLLMTRDPVPSIYHLAGFRWCWSALSIAVLALVSIAFLATLSS